MLNNFFYPFKKNNLLFILGNGGFSKEVKQTVWQSGKIKNIYCIDDKTTYCGDYFVDGKNIAEKVRIFRDRENCNIFLVPGVGSPELKRRWGREFSNEFFDEPNFPAWLNVIDKTVFIDKTVRLGKGVIIQKGCILTTNVKVGSFVTLNLNVTVGHDTTIGMYANISPGVNISGNVEIGEGCDIGSNAVILPGVKMPPNGVIGAGTVVTKNSVEFPEEFTKLVNCDVQLVKSVPDHDKIQSYTIVGNPGKIIKINGGRV